MDKLPAGGFRILLQHQLLGELEDLVYLNMKGLNI